MNLNCRRNSEKHPRIPGGTGHWPVAAGDPPAARAPRASAVVHGIVVPQLGGKLPPRTGRWPVPPGPGPDASRRRRNADGYATIIVLALIVIVGALLVSASRHAASMRRELRLVEEKQQARLGRTNAPVVLSPAGVRSPIRP